MSYFDELRRILKAQNEALTASRAVRLNPHRYKISPHKTEILKRRIITRLRTEDYTCRMPEEWHIEKPKPRVRYKLTKCLHYSKYDETVWTKETVYK